MTLLQCKRCGTRELAEKPRIFHRTQRECLAALGARVAELEQLTKKLVPPEPSVTQELPIPAPPPKPVMLEQQKPPKET